MSIAEEATRETAHESGGYVKGLAIGIVTQNNDPSKLCRVKVRYSWNDQNESEWARLLTPMAGPDRGLVLIPEVGDEVLLAFEREDVRFPYVLGALWNGQQKPPVANDDGKNDKRMLQSRKKHYLLFDDGAKGVVELKHEKGRRVVLDDNGFLVEDENGNRVKVDSTSGAMTLEAKGQLSISAASIKLEAKTTIEIKASATLTVRGSLVQIN
ncbi:MAG TPA: phage baseplate assembly protein V [Thermoanaerobaculia bacterium]|nr:phage baseplate assembly protein V [Thermoanaerobaculia bacterium]